MTGICQAGPTLGKARLGSKTLPYGYPAPNEHFKMCACSPRSLWRRLHHTAPRHQCPASVVDGKGDVWGRRYGNLVHVPRSTWGFPLAHKRFPNRYDTHGAELADFARTLHTTATKRRNKQHRNENEPRRRSLVCGLILFFSRCCCCHVGFTRVEPACRSTKKKACSMFVLFAKRRRSETSFFSWSGMVAGWREAGFADGTPTLWSALFGFLCTGRSCPAYVFARQNPRGPSYVSKGLPAAP